MDRRACREKPRGKDKPPSSERSEGSTAQTPQPRRAATAVPSSGASQDSNTAVTTHPDTLLLLYTDREIQEIPFSPVVQSIWGCKFWLPIA